MNANSLRLKSHLCAATMLAGLMMISACVAPRSAPQQVQASNPSVTYQYRNDDELIQANQRAATFCDQYQYGPRTVSISNNQDGSRMVVFECVQTSATPVRQYNSDLTYNYRSDQELMDATWNARSSCMNTGSRQVTSSTVVNANGSKTVTFRCM